MTAHVLRADSRHLPLADSSVDLICTSPPYWSLRSYQDGGGHYAGQVGDEATPAEFVAALLAVTAECVRVLKSSGSLWVNLGDKYASGGRTSYDTTDINGARGGVRAKDGMRPKTLLGLPWRYALACIDDLGLILRAEVIWSKPNGLPESVTDRVRRSHETWFHLTKEPRYFSAVDEVREATTTPLDRYKPVGYGTKYDGDPRQSMSTASMLPPNPLGKLPGSVWTVPTQPLTVPAHLGVDHFAAFPMEWPRRIIRGWSPSGICVECGEGRRPVAERMADGRERGDSGGGARGTKGLPGYGDVNRSDWQEVRRLITGEACACPTPTAPTRPATVLDPFGGTGTTALVASALGRVGISCDLSHDYSRLARWRTSDPGQRAAAMQVEKPKPEVDGQDSLFGDVA